MPEYTSIDVVIVEDDADQRQLYSQVLTRAGFCVEVADSAQSGWELVERLRPRLVLSDYVLPDQDGLSLCAKLRQNRELCGTYFVLMSAIAEPALLHRALDEGADEFLRKPISFPELIARVRVGMRIWTMHEQLRRAAITDGLTQLYNHDHLIRILDNEMNRARRYGHPLAVFMLDIDFFKAVNDTYGHLAGNSTLERIAAVLRASVRDVDVVGRFGGEEFAVLLPESTVNDAKQVAERVRTTIAATVRPDELRSHVVTASIGIADTEDQRVRSAADLIDLADRALYLAKRRGRNQIACCEELNDAGDLAAGTQTDEVEWLKRRLAALSVRAKDVYIQSVASLLQALDEKDPYTGRHAINVAFYAEQIAEHMELSPATVKTIHNAALLHDIGKVGVPDRILMKQSPLTSIEKMVLDQVPLIGTRIVDHLRILESEIQIIRHQREYFDGSGIPAGLSGDRIPIGSRILLVADAFDAMSTDRIYRERRPISKVIGELRRNAGRQFDPDIVSVVEEILRDDESAWKARIDETINTLSAPVGT